MSTRIGRLLSWARISATTRKARPIASVEQDFLKQKIELGFTAKRFLARYSVEQYQGILRRLTRFQGRTAFRELLVDSPSKILRFDFEFLSDQFLKAQIDGDILDLTHLQIKHARFLKRLSDTVPRALPAPQRVPQRITPRGALVRGASKLLTEELLFNPKSGVEYPRTVDEYRALMSKILDEHGRFPGDEEGLTPWGTFSARSAGASHHALVRRSQPFQVEVFSPRLHANGTRNRLIFDADLISQGASFDAYGTRGVSYDREFYYTRRLFNAEMVPFIRIGGWPISFAALQGYETQVSSADLYYAFIHFVMTRGMFQGSGLTSYSIRDGMSRLYYENIWRNRPNLMFDSKGRLQDYRLRMWAAAHSGRMAPFYPFAKSFQGIDPSWLPIAQAVFADVHSRITPPEELQSRGSPISAKVVRVNGGQFPVAVDEGVYPLHTRYPVKGGAITFPQSEVDLPAAIKETWLDAIGGEEGVVAGNALYFAGLVTLGKIRAAKKRDRQRDGGGVLERAGNSVRSWVVKQS